MRRALAALLALSLCPTPGLALSCLRPDVARSFHAAEAAEEVYIIVHGTLTFDPARLPVTDWNNQSATPQHTRIAARLTGAALTARGFTAAFDQEITLDARCFGPWCANAEPGVDVLAFLERQATGGYLAVLDPCNSLSFQAPTQAQLDQAQSCMRGAACVPRD